MERGRREASTEKEGIRRNLERMGLEMGGKEAGTGREGGTPQFIIASCYFAGPVEMVFFESNKLS